MFDITKYLRERRIDFAESAGWVNTVCPFCRSDVHGSDPKKKYLGFELAEGYLNCWRCGGHSAEDFVMLVERCEYHEACRIVIEYSHDHVVGHAPKLKPKAVGLQGKLEWPPGSLPLQAPHKAYLAKRNFDPDFLETKYRLKGTGPAGEYCWRVIVPIFLNGQFVSYQGRDITGRSNLRYFACKPELELVSHKEILCNLDNAKGDALIVVEGWFDVFRLGDGAVAAIGTTVTKTQILAMAKFKRVFTLLDAEPETQTKARKIRDQLAVLGVKAVNIKLSDGDPGDLSQSDADHLKMELLKCPTNPSRPGPERK